MVIDPLLANKPPGLFVIDPPENVIVADDPIAPIDVKVPPVITKLDKEFPILAAELVIEKDPPARLSEDEGPPAIPAAVPIASELVPVIIPGDCKKIVALLKERGAERLRATAPFGYKLKVVPVEAPNENAVVPSIVIDPACGELLLPVFEEIVQLLVFGKIALSNVPGTPAGFQAVEFPQLLPVVKVFEIALKEITASDKVRVVFNIN